MHCSHKGFEANTSHNTCSIPVASYIKESTNLYRTKMYGFHTSNLLYLYITFKQGISSTIKQMCRQNVRNHNLSYPHYFIYSTNISRKIVKRTFIFPKLTRLLLKVPTRHWSCDTILSSQMPQNSWKFPLMNNRASIVVKGTLPIVMIQLENIN